MSWSKDITIWCDYPGCHAWTYGSGSNHTVITARTGAKAEGWASIGGKDFCPDHSPPRGTTDVRTGASLHGD